MSFLLSFSRFNLRSWEWMCFLHHLYQMQIMYISNSSKFGLPINSFVTSSSSSKITLYSLFCSSISLPSPCILSFTNGTMYVSMTLSFLNCFSTPRGSERYRFITDQNEKLRSNAYHFARHSWTFPRRWKTCCT